MADTEEAQTRHAITQARLASVEEVLRAELTLAVRERNALNTKISRLRSQLTRQAARARLRALDAQT